MRPFERAIVRLVAIVCIVSPAARWLEVASHDALVRAIRDIGGFEISVAAYPERHPESVSIEEDLAFMADKAENGATRAISQFFFHNSFFLRLRDRVMARGIAIDLVPGILPITSFARVSEFAAKCGAHITRAVAVARAKHQSARRSPRRR